MAIPAAAIGAVAGPLLGGLLGGKQSDRARGANTQITNQAISDIEEARTRAQEAFQSGFDDALASLAGGELEASDEILVGLGMSIEERTKFFDIAKDNLEWVVDFGKSQRGNFQGAIQSSNEALSQSRKFLGHYSELIFNPDSIYDTEVYNSIKNRSIQEWGNFYSGKGLLGGNAQEAMIDRMSQLAYGFLQGERQAALQGVNAGNALSGAFLNQAGTSLDAIRTGAQGSSQIANLAFGTGDANARDIMNAFGSLAGVTEAFNPASTQFAGGQIQSNIESSAGIGSAEARLAGALGNQNISNNLTNSLITAGTSLLPTLIGAFGKAPTTAPTGEQLAGARTSSFAPASSGFNFFGPSFGKAPVGNVPNTLFSGGSQVPSNIFNSLGKQRIDGSVDNTGLLGFQNNPSMSFSGPVERPGRDLSFLDVNIDPSMTLSAPVLGGGVATGPSTPVTPPPVPIVGGFQNFQFPDFPRTVQDPSPGFQSFNFPNNRFLTLN